jgi:hypothetical protein
VDWKPWWALLVITLLIGSGIAIADQPSVESVSDTITVSIGGGTLTYPADLETGPRWLQTFVPNLPGPYLIQPDGTQVPGDGKDGDELVITERRITDHDYHDRPQTGSVMGQGIHGTPDAWICICDIELILWNKQATDMMFFRFTASSYIWIDNVTVYGGALSIRDSQHVKVTHGTYIDGGGVRNQLSTDVRVHQNNFIKQQGVLQFYDHPQVLDECWPNHITSCNGTGVVFFGGTRGLVDQNYFTGGGGTVSTTISNLRVIQNSFYNSGHLLIGPYGEASWNLIRGWESAAQIHAPGSIDEPIWIHNNSMVLPHEIDIRGNGYKMMHGVYGISCECVVENNDFIGYGLAGNIMVNAQYIQNPAVIAGLGSTVYADNNYWGTLHDPRIPEGWWIREYRGGQAIVNTWFTEPIHPVTVSAMYTPQDIPHWIDQILEDGIPLPAP